MKTLISAILGLVLLATQLAARQAGRTPVGPPALGWAVDRADLAANVKFEPAFGREDAMLLRANTHVVKTGLDLGDGTIEFDLAPTAEGHFTGITFRRQSFTNHENVYLRFHRSGDFMAMQYAPRVNGSSTWQLYPEFATTVEWPRERWTRVRIELKGSRMDVFTGDANKAALSVPRLRNATTGGEFALWARVNDKPAEWAVAISNLRITKAASNAALTPAPNAPPQFVWNWQVSDPVSAAGRIDTLPASLAASREVKSEESGLVNINRLFPVQKGRSVIFAKHTFTADAARRVIAGIGYSDDVSVFVNGELVYAGINAWDSRTPALNSFVDARWESVVLPFKAGANEVVLAVADDQRFGWGFAMKIEDAAGLKF
ncbi:MAG TPA: hypothetical protein VFZ31_11890 [Vicinamibacterales bacterium]